MTAPAKPPAGVTQQQRSVGAERGSWGRRTRVVFQSGARITRFYWGTHSGSGSHAGQQEAHPRSSCITILTTTVISRLRTSSLS